MPPSVLFSLYFLASALWSQARCRVELPTWHKQIQMLLFGQAATMSDIHIWIYGGLALFVALFLFLTFRPLQASLFDRDFAMSAEIPVALEQILFWLLLLSLIVGIRSVGVVLMSGMVIAPAVAARQFTDRLQTVFVLAGFFGALSGLLGNYLSVAANLPTGPMIVLVGTRSRFSLSFGSETGASFRICADFGFPAPLSGGKYFERDLEKGNCFRDALLTSDCPWRLRRHGLDQSPF